MEQMSQKIIYYNHFDLISEMQVLLNICKSVSTIYHLHRRVPKMDVGKALEKTQQ